VKVRASLANGLVFAVVGVACWSRTFDVGTTRAPPDAEVDDGAAIGDAVIDPHDALDGPAQDAPESAYGTCAASGKGDKFFTANELTNRLIGWWAQCPGVMVSPLPCSPSAPVWGIRFSADGTYALLGADTELATFVEQTDPCGLGTFRIYSPAIAGDGGASQYVPLDDTQPRAGLEVHLFGQAAPLDVELPEFETEPRRMFLREQGQVGSAGYFSPIPPALR
jgi:hypothetical protein